jgi:hypothetical protein
MMTLELTDFMCFGLPWSLLYFVTFYYAISINLFHINYFHLTCYYLSIKMERIRERFVTDMSGNSIENRLVNLNNALMDINDLNKEFWKPILATLCYHFSGFIIFNVYQAFYSKVSTIFIIAYADFSIFNLQLNSLILLSASRLSSAVSRIYFNLNQVNIKMKDKKISSKIKVIFKPI